MTFADAVASSTSNCATLSEKVARVKALLDATEEALFNSAVNGGVREYKVNTGQTVISVTSSSVAELTRQHRNLYSLYNNLCGLAGGSNVMVMRDASTIRR